MNWIITFDIGSDNHFAESLIGSGVYEPQLKSPIIKLRQRWFEFDEHGREQFRQLAIAASSHSVFTHEFRIVDEQGTTVFAGRCEEPKGISKFDPLYWASVSRLNLKMETRLIGETDWKELK